MNQILAKFGFICLTSVSIPILAVLGEDRQIASPGFQEKREFFIKILEVSSYKLARSAVEIQSERTGRSGLLSIFQMRSGNSRSFLDFSALDYQVENELFSSSVKNAVDGFEEHHQSVLAKLMKEISLSPDQAMVQISEIETLKKEMGSLFLGEGSNREKLRDLVDSITALPPDFVKLDALINFEEGTNLALTFEKRRYQIIQVLESEPIEEAILKTSYLGQKLIQYRSELTEQEM